MGSSPKSGPILKMQLLFTEIPGFLQKSPSAKLGGPRTFRPGIWQNKSQKQDPRSKDSVIGPDPGAQDQPPFGSDQNQICGYTDDYHPVRFLVIPTGLVAMAYCGAYLNASSLRKGRQPQEPSLSGRARNHPTAILPSETRGKSTLATLRDDLSDSFMKSIFLSQEGSFRGRARNHPMAILPSETRGKSTLATLRDDLSDSFMKSIFLSQGGSFRGRAQWQFYHQKLGEKVL